MPYYLERCAEILSGSTVKASTTIGFPHGGHTTAIQANAFAVAEAEQALADGGQKLDMAVNISKVLSEDWEYVRDDIQAVVDVTHAHSCARLRRLTSRSRPPAACARWTGCSRCVPWA
jgi:deoxyribose-phosphate aldolase